MNKLGNTPTALSSWMWGLAQELIQRGLDAKTLFEQCGLDFALLNQPEARYTVAKTTDLWNKAVELTGDEALGLKVVKHITPATFHAVGLSVLASENLEQAFQRMSRFIDLITDASQMKLGFTAQGEFVAEILLREGALPATQSIDGFMALLANSGKGLGDPTLTPLRVELMRAAPSADLLPVFERYFGAPVQYGCDHLRLTYTKQAVQTRLKGGNAFVAEHLDQASQAAIDRIKPSASLAMQLSQWVRAQLATGTPGIEDAASHLNMSARNLQRKLAEENTTLGQIIDEVRQVEAKNRLKLTQDPVLNIALDLGFSDSSSFSRACKRWFGKSPSELRQ
ncbi:MAG TPA: AraC family transcriptional regulator [Limnobacter sp.]|nr:AraC family transcriptional regulator [Limnobacter sp.]